MHNNGNRWDVIIHWFEFNWVILEKLLLKEPSPTKGISIIEQFGVVCFNRFESTHPVDWLYNKFIEYETKSRG